MNVISKTCFWGFTIFVGFVNPLFSMALIVLYYLPGIIQDLCKPCEKNELNSYSDHTLEEMK